MSETVLNISDSGVVQVVYTDDLRPLLDEGKSSIRRASHVEPDGSGQWWAIMTAGPVLGPFANRPAAIAAELEWINDRLAAGQTVGL